MNQIGTRPRSVLTGLIAAELDSDRRRSSATLRLQDAAELDSDRRRSSGTLRLQDAAELDSDRRRSSGTLRLQDTSISSSPVSFNRLTEKRRSDFGCSLLTNDSFESTCGSCQATNISTPCGSTVGIPTDPKEYVGIFEVFKIGIGPSSSHTNGPMTAGKMFVQELSDGGNLFFVTRVAINLYGSLALTGKGHSTDKAAVLGLAGYKPSTINPDEAEKDFDKILSDKMLVLNMQHPIEFTFNQDLIFNYDTELPLHPNGISFEAYGKEQNNEELIWSQTYYSIGGGFVKTEAEMPNGHKHPKPIRKQLDIPIIESPRSPCSTAASDSVDQLEHFNMGDTEPIPYFYKSAYELLHLCKENGLTIPELIYQNEMSVHKISRDELYRRIDEIANIMDACVDRGLRMEGNMPVSLMPRRAVEIKRRLEKTKELGAEDALAVCDWISLYARAVNEENACGGRIVTSPTNGAAGTLPAVLTYYRRHIKEATVQGVRDFLAVAAAIGSLCKRNASISGAEAGCQAEIGSACSMAAGALCSVLGGTLSQTEYAAEIGLEHCLGMTCDPIGGLVQIPCIERNSVAAIKAVTASRLSLLSSGLHQVSLDSCIETMYRTGLDMQTKYRETSTGGLALYASKMPDF